MYCKKWKELYIFHSPNKKKVCIPFNYWHYKKNVCKIMWETLSQINIKMSAVNNKGIKFRKFVTMTCLFRDLAFEGSEATNI